MTDLNERARRFRSAISAFIEARRDAKLKGKEDAPSTAAKYDYDAWLSDAARRVGQIQAVTHVIKATHPDARGSSLHMTPGRLPAHAEVGSHVLGDDFAEDVVGNAAALDVFKFLKIEVDGRRLLDWVQERDADLLRALHEDAATASEWAAAFGGLVRSVVEPVSHQAAKQVYWLVGDEPGDDANYHLLQPLFSSSLAHAVHTEVQDARFGDVNKEARQAFREKRAFDGSYRDYRHLVARKLGGTKPQNISQLNSERGGVNYLLASLPPRWASDRFPHLLRIDSAFDRFTWFEGVQPLLKVFAKFLLSDPDRNRETREKREKIEQALGAQLLLFAATQRARLTPGWTRDPDCRLEKCERLWLDPERTTLPVSTDHAEADIEFVADYDRGDWPDEIAGRFANWLNQRLRDAGVPALGDVQQQHWARQAIVEAAWPVPMQRRAGGEA